VGTQFLHLACQGGRFSSLVSRQLHQRSANFSPGGPVSPGMTLQSGPQSNNECLAHAILLQLVLNMAQIHREIWAYVCCSNMLRLVKIIAINGTRNVLLCSSFQSRLENFDLGSAQLGNNFFTDRHRVAAWCFAGSSYTTTFHTV